MKPILRILSAVALQALSAAALAAPKDQSWWDSMLQTWHEGKPAHVIEVENDSLLLKRDDGMYTSGARYRLQNWQSSPWQAWMTEWRIGSEIYTPLDIKLSAARVGPPDHPYAAWLYMGIAHTQYQKNGSLLGFGLDIGCLGPCAKGEQIQTRLHRIIRQPLPQGWSRQIKDEWGVVAHADWAGAYRELSPFADLQLSSRLRFGNIYTDASLHARLRAGSLNDLPQQSARYAYLGLQARAVGYDATMQGGYFSKNNLHTVQPKRLVGEIELGLQWQAQNWAGKLGVIRRSNTVRELENRLGAQNFASVQLSYTPR